MADQPELESLYREAQAALKGRDYVRASDLLRQILLIDENYKDTSRLLAQVVKLRRRRWYNHPLLWGVVGIIALVALGFFVTPRLRGFYAVQPSAPVVISSPTSTLPPTAIVTTTATLLPTPTPIPLTWKRVSIGQEFERDTVTAFVIDPKDPEVLYAGIKNAGIYKSIDGGLSWRPAHYGLLNTHVTSLLIDSQNPRIVYTGTGDGIYKTEDGGENWSKFFEGNSLLIDPQDSSHLYVRDANHIYESTDQGNNWKTAYSSEEGCPGKIYSWAIHPVDGKTLFIIGGEECEWWGVYESNNSGRSWTLITDYKFEIPPGANVLDYGVDKLFVGLDSQGNLDIYPYGTAAYDSTGSFVYYDWDFGLYKKNLNEEQRLILGKPDVRGVTSITISPYDPNIIYVGGEGLSVSRDGGLTWTKLNNGLGSEVLYLDVSSGDTPVLYLQSGECEEARRTTQKKYYLGAFQDDAGQPLYISANGGRTWDLSLQNGCYLVRDTNDMILYRVGQDWVWTVDGDHLRRWLWLSKDQGKSWQGAYILDIGEAFTIVADPVKDGILFAYSPESFDSTASGVRGGEKKIISEDYGNTWKNSDAVTGIKSCYGSTPQFIDAYRPMAIDPSDGNHVFVIDNGVLLESHDSCDTTQTFATAPNTSMNSIAFDPNNPDTIYVGTDGGAYISFDSGKTWGQINDGLLGATVVYSIVVDKDSNVYAATPYGIFKLDGK